MALPTINPTTSVLGYKQWEYWEYQPLITSDTTPTCTCANLPGGMAVDSATGKIYGASSVPGVFLVELKVTNTTGSVTMTLTMGIEASSVQPVSGVDVFIDVTTGAVALPTGATPIPWKKDTTAPLLACKEGDDLLLYVRFTKGGIILDLDITSLQLAGKELEPEGLVLQSGLWEKSGSGTAAVYKLHAKFNSAALGAALGNYEDDAGTAFVAMCEIERVENFAGIVGVSSLRSTSRSFGVLIERDFGEVA